MKRNKLEFLNIVFHYLYYGLLPICDFGSCCGVYGIDYYIDFDDYDINTGMFESLLKDLKDIQVITLSIVPSDDKDVLFTLNLKDMSHGKK